MALKAILEKLDDAPEALREHYTEQDGKFVLGVEPVGGWALEDVTGLKSALGSERTQREKLERDVVKFKDIDPDKARTALAELEELKKLDPEKEADKIANSKLESAKNQLLEKHGLELGARDQRIGQLSSTVQGLLIDQAATVALAEAKGAVELLLPHVRAHTRVKEVDGKFSVEVIGADGNPRISPAPNNTGPMTIQELVAEMRASDTFGRAFDGDGQSGGDKKPDNGGNVVTVGDLGGSAEERRAYLAKKYKLPAA